MTFTVAQILPLAAAFLCAVGLLVAAEWQRRRSQLAAHWLATAGVVSLFYFWQAAIPGGGLVPWRVGAGLTFATALLVMMLASRFGWLLLIVGFAGAMSAASWRPNEPEGLAVLFFALYLFLVPFGFGIGPILIRQILGKRIAPKLGLEWHEADAPAPLWSGIQLKGSLRGFHVKVASKDFGVLRIEVQGVDPGFTLRRETARNKTPGRGVETGAPDFDGRTRIEGDEDLVFALLDHSTRRAVSDLLTGDKYDGIYGGALRKKVFSLREIRPTLDTLLDLAERLRRPSPQQVPELLSRRALDDPEPDVRLQAFRRLVSNHSKSKIWHQTARALRDSEDEALRRAACRALLRESGSVGAEAAGKLMDVVRQSPDLSRRREAMEAVAGSSFAKDHVSAMVALLGSGDDTPSELRLPALRGLIEARALDELLRLKLSHDSEEAFELARGLGQIGDVRAQPRLLELLEHPRNRVRSEAVEALGDIGDIHAVEKLRNLIDSGFLAKMTLGGAVESAIAQIQTRLGGSQAGEISLAEVTPLDGAVSPAEDDEGPAVGSPGGELSLESSATREPKTQEAATEETATESETGEDVADGR